MCAALRKLISAVLANECLPISVSFHSQCLSLTLAKSAKDWCLSRIAVACARTWLEGFFFWAPQELPLPSRLRRCGDPSYTSYRVLTLLHRSDRHACPFPLLPSPHSSLSLSLLHPFLSLPHSLFPSTRIVY